MKRFVIAVLIIAASFALGRYERTERDKTALKLATIEAMPINRPDPLMTVEYFFSHQCPQQKKSSDWLIIQRTGEGKIRFMRRGSSRGDVSANEKWIDFDFDGASYGRIFYTNSYSQYCVYSR